MPAHVQLAGADGSPPRLPPSQPLAFGPVPFDRAIEAARERGVVLPDTYYGQLQGLARWQSFTATGLAGAAQIRALKESLDQVIANGETFEQWRKSALAGKVPLGLPGYRLENIFRTNTQAAYMRGRGEQMLARVRTHPYWMYDAVNDGRTRPAHRAMDGTILRHDNPWWTTHYPPNGYQCFLPGTMVHGLPVLGLKAWYAGPAVEVVTAKGGRLRVTANHPVLTARGWLPAHRIAEGDHLLSASGVIDSLVGVVVDDQQPPATCEDLFQSLARDGLRVGKVAPLDLHGDGIGTDGEVHVACSDGVLLRNRNAEGLQGADHGSFIRADARLVYDASVANSPPPRDAALNSGFSDDPLHVAGSGPESASNGAAGKVRGAVELADLAFQRFVLSVAGSPGGRELAIHQQRIGLDGPPLQELGLGLSANRNAALHEDSVKDASADTAFVAELLQACAGSIALDQVVSIRQFQFVGHVYDFQTETGLILAESFVVHNCRCLVRALTEAEAKRRGITSVASADGPDPGWEYSVLQDAKHGLLKATQTAQANLPTALGQALQQALAVPPPIPNGPLVANGLDILPGAAQAVLQRTVGIIDSLHGDGVLPKIPALADAVMNSLGEFSYMKATKVPHDLRIHPGGPWPDLTAAHEIGHFLDLAGIGAAGKFATTADPVMAGVLAALAASPQIQGLRALKQTKHVRYLLKREEQWARAYAQWVATRSADAKLRQQLAAALANDPLRQWTDVDFRPIAIAIDRLFKVLGWVQ